MAAPWIVAVGPTAATFFKTVPVVRWMKIKSSLVLLALIAATLLAVGQKAPSADEQGVRDAILDYVEGVYNVQPDRIERSVSRDLVKRGFSFSRQKQEYSKMLPMSFDQLRELAANWNNDGKAANAESPKEIQIYEVTDKTASAKLTAAWGMDYFHLAKVDGKWMIVNVLWQSAPRGLSR